MAGRCPGHPRGWAARVLDSVLARGSDVAGAGPRRPCAIGGIAATCATGWHAARGRPICPKRCRPGSQCGVSARFPSNPRRADVRTSFLRFRNPARQRARRAFRNRRAWPTVPHIVDFRLDNGLTVVVIPDHRAPVVTHMVWYRNGSADDPPGKSGIAHFLEHLMFKGTDGPSARASSPKSSPNSAARRTPSPATITPPISSASPRSISA